MLEIAEELVKKGEPALKCLECMTECSQWHGNREKRKSSALHKVCSGTEGHKGNDDDYVGNNQQERTTKKVASFPARESALSLYYRH